ncbi:hypothetical protein SAMD00019534_080840, partial [Acytostelium subglobosum LB1]|uniref:hypothetical protein n=1 Tax=Acytostelium subglobosum LB1 TaxID=1410327 RepID=UPI0006452386
RSFKMFMVFPAIAAGLGTWQVYRYQWKKDLIQTAKDNVEKPPVTMNTNIVNGSSSGSKVGANQLEFRRVELTGTYTSGNSIHLGPRTNDNNVGYYIITPLKLDDSDTKILVNRGWDMSEVVGQHVKIQGLIGKAKEAGSMFTPDNVPAKNQWYFIDAKDMAATVDASPVIVNMLEETFVESAPKAGRPVPSSALSLKRFDTNIENNFYNKHMTYIFTWYGLSGCLTFIYYKYMRGNIPLGR